MNVNGTAVIVLDEEENDVKKSNMEEREHRLKTDSIQKPLDTRLHHYVPVDDIDRKVVNGSDGTHITIPEDAVISFTTGRVRVKKSASNSPQSVGDRESIPLATMPPSYTEEKTGLGEKAELEAELANHKNGVWSEGHNYGSAEGPFSNSEKLNGTSKSSDEVSLPVNNHRKCLRGEKLYFTEDNRKLCPGWRRILICGLILIIIAVALLLGVLAATGILLAESENKNTRYESGQSLPSVDSLSLAGHSFRPRPPPKVPEKFLPPVTVDAQIPPNVTPEANDEVNDTVSQTPATVSSKVPAMNDTSHSQTIVPNALIGEFTIINENFTEDLRDNRSQGYMNLAGHLKAELRRIFKKSNAVFESLKILNFSPGSLKVKFLVIWQSDSGFILANQASEILSSDLIEKNNSFGGFFVVDIGSIHFTDVFDECRIQKGGCSFFCIWNYNTLTKTCTCPGGMVLLPDKRSCAQRDLVIPVTSTARTSTFSPAAITSTLTNKMRTESEPSNLGITAVSSVQDVLTTEEVPTTVKNDNPFTMTNFTDVHTEKPLEYTTTEISTTSLDTSVETTYNKMFTTLEPLKTTNVNRETSHEGAFSKFIPLTTQATSFPSVKDTGISEELITPMFLTTEYTETPKELTTPGTTVMTNTEILDQLGKEEENNKQDEFSTTVVEDSPKLVAEQTTAVTFPESTTNKKTPKVTTEEVATSTMERVTSSASEDEFGTMSIGFHITGPTTEIYTLKENTDYITDYSSRGHQTSSTTVNSQDSATEQTSTLPTNKYIINGNEDNFYVTTVLSSDSTVTSAISTDNDGTENFKQNHSTLNPLKE
ncbi:uncharacterized protein LOC118193362 isoform X2 [Stegodyphus dumicola]|uniref:uncharacterized protein LOC118193362 isoform X2 n=1 Tax=Stegodyphus dumicola TaxID=202533 RepID=UPI0015ADD044|nr:uncharacterized protein LOC118193362 isoform X2 [Stegodyphus dumicola]